MDVRLLWFRCKNPDCNHVRDMPKKEKVKRFWRHGQSIQQSAHRLHFMRYVQGEILKRNEGNQIIFVCKYGEIVLYDTEPDAIFHGYYYPIEDAELCNPCINKQSNDKVLFQ